MSRLVTVLAALALAACGPTTARPAAPVGAVAPAPGAPPPIDAAALRARADEIAGAASTRCLLDRLDADEWSLPETIADDAPPVVVELAYHVWTTQPGLDDRRRWRRLAIAALTQARTGALGPARAALAEADAIGARDGELVVWDLDEVRIVLGLPTRGTPALDDIPALVAAGRRAEAAAVWKAIAPAAADSPVVIARALFALDARAELDRLAALPGEDDLRPTDLEVTWAAEAVRTGRGLAPALAALARLRAEDPGVDGEIAGLVIDPAETLGRSAEVAALARAMRADPRKYLGRDLALLDLHDAALARGDDDEVAAIEAALAGAHGRARTQFPVQRALRRADLADALATVEGFQHTEPGTAAELVGRITAGVRRHGSARLWARHVAEGFTPAHEALLVHAWCGR